MHTNLSKLGLLSGLILTGACTDPVSPPAAATSTPAVGVAVAVSQEISPRLLRRFKPLRSQLTHDGAPSEALTQLGRMLYFETRLSASKTISCNSCHPLASYGATQEPTSTGIHGKKGSRNAPTTYNAAGHFSQFWDGRSPNVEEQAKGPLLNPVEMGMPGPKVVAALEAIPGYVTAFRAAFPGAARPISFDNVGKAIGAFERGLVTPSRWDRYLLGDTTALTDLEKEGGQLFTNLDCLVCHTGELVGGATFEKVGRVKPWPNQGDRGRQAVTGHEGDGMTFKVPSLRNVARTAPYFHDGSAATLEEAVRMMATYQLGDDLTNDETHAIVAFLGALTGDLPVAYITPPALPPGAQAVVAGGRP